MNQGEELLLKVSLKDKKPPLAIHLKYADPHQADLTLFVSYDLRDPTSASNHGVYSNVSLSLPSSLNLETAIRAQRANRK